MIAHDNNELNVSWLCENAGISRSGYYNWLKTESTRNSKETKDHADFELILKAYQHRGYDKGRRGIYMRLLHMGIVMNQKKISRLMKKYNLFCPIRKANPYRRMAKAIQTDSVSDNLINREFREHGAGMIILTDITYLFYNKGNKAYLSVMKDACAKQILAYVPSQSLEVDFVLATINMLLEEHGEELQTDPLFILTRDVTIPAFLFVNCFPLVGLSLSNFCRFSTIGVLSLQKWKIKPENCCKFYKTKIDDCHPESP